MDINALLNPYARDSKPGVGDTTDSVEPVTEKVEGAAPESGIWFHGELVTEDTVVAEAAAAASTAAMAPADETIDTIETINALDQIEETDFVPMDDPVSTEGRHRADVPPDSVSPLVATVATHRLSA